MEGPLGAHGDVWKESPDPARPGSPARPRHSRVMSVLFMLGRVGGLGGPVASRAWCVQAAVMLACPAVLQDPDAGRSWLPGDLAVAVRALQAHRVKCAKRRAGAAWPGLARGGGRVGRRPWRA